LTGNVIWYRACSPFTVSGSVVVASDAVLSIEPGVEVRFASGKGLQVDGVLVARGTDTQPITFTSSSGTSAAGDWQFISFTDSSVDATFDGSGNYVGGSVLQYCQVQYGGGSGASGMIQLTAAAPWIDHCVIKNSAQRGVWASGVSGLRLTNNTISDNVSTDTGGGVYLSGAAVIDGNTISGNRGAGYYGGGGIHAAGGPSTVSNNVISDNRSTSWSGGAGIHVASGSVTISGNTISGNTATSGGNGMTGGGV